MKNKFISGALALLVCALAFALTGCGSKNKPAASDGKLVVVTTIFPPYDFARAVAGGKAEITMLLSPGAETHSFEPRPQDIIKIQKSGVFIYTGGESDTWVENILKSMDTSKMKIVAMTECVETVEEEIVDGMQDDEEEGENARNNENGEDSGEKPEYDEHVWTSPRNAKAIVRKIADALIEADSANAGAYRQNAEAYIAELDVLDAKFQSVVDSAVRKTLVFGDRFPFRYFTDAYGLKYFAAFPGCATETEASAKTVAFLINKVKEEKIPVVFHIELSNKKMAETISEATGAKVRLLHSCHNIAKTDFEAGKTYIDLMSANVETLSEALR
jgi:zinc transport system substrate-binding protein